MATECRPSTHPDAELNRVRGVLHSLIDVADVSKYAKEALMRGIHVEPTAMYRYLYNVAEFFNPYKRQDSILWRKRCMQMAFTYRSNNSPAFQQRCRIAATFYLLSEGLYSMPRLPDLTQ